MALMNRIIRWDTSYMSNTEARIYEAAAVVLFLAAIVALVVTY
jgi:hypothetical protein